MTTEEIKVVVKGKHQEDTLRALQRLANLGSEAADVITQVDPTREVVREAMRELRDERKAQVHLAGMLTASRFKTHVQQGVVPIECPTKTRFARDSFWHMLECYHLESQVRRGVAAAPFLVSMARTTLLEGRANLIPRPPMSPPS